MRLSMFVAVLAFSAAPLAQTAAPSPAELAARVQAHYASVKDFTADWSLTQKRALSPKVTEERGVLKVKKPLKMRWTYTTGDKSEFIVDGIKVYAVFTRD